MRSAASARRSCLADIFGRELRGAFPTKQRILGAARLVKHFGGFAVLLDGFVEAILLLLQESVTCDAFRRLVTWRGSQETIVDRECFDFVARLDQQVEQQSVVNRGAVRLLHARVQVAQGLRRFLVLRRCVDHRQIRFDRILDTILLEEALGAIQVLADVCGHPCGLPLP